MDGNDKKDVGGLTEGQGGGSGKKNDLRSEVESEIRELLGNLRKSTSKTEADTKVKAEVKPAEVKNAEVKVEAPKAEVKPSEVKKAEVKVEAPKAEVKPAEVKKPEVKVEEPKAEVKPSEVKKPEVKSETPKAEVKHSEVKKPEVKAEAPKTDVKPLEVKKPEVKVEVPKAEVKSSEVKKPEVKSEVPKADVKPSEVKKPEVKSEAPKAEVKPSEVKKPEVKSEAPKAKVKPAEAKKPEVKAESPKADVKAEPQKEDIKPADEKDSETFAEINKERDRYEYSDDISGYSETRMSTGRKAMGKVKLIATLAAIGAIALIVTFFTVRNNSYKYNFDQALSLFKQEEYPDAIDAFVKLEGTDEGSKDVELMDYLGKAYMAQEKYDDALNTYNRLLQVNPNYGPAVSSLCEIHTLKKDGPALNSVLEKYRGTNLEEYIREYTVNPPKTSIEAGVYQDDQEITIQGETGIPVFYTLDGSDPTTQSNIYMEPIRISEGKTHLKAIAINTLGIKSGIVDNEYEVAYRIPDEPVINLNSGMYITGKTVTIESEEGTEIRYTTDGSNPTASSELYDGPLRLVRGNVVLSAIAVTGHGKESSVTRKNYIIVQNAKEMQEIENMNQNPSESADGQNGETQEGQEGQPYEGSEKPEETTTALPAQNGEAQGENAEDSGAFEQWETQEGEGMFDWLRDSE